MQEKKPLCGLLHLTGALLSIVGTILLVIKAGASTVKLVSFYIYGATLVALYLSSTLYHLLPKSAGGEAQVFRKLDHLAIYGLIAGTYTPFCLITLHGPWGWTILSIIWGLALLLITLQAIYINLPRWLTTSAYIVMGWIIVVAFVPLWRNLPLGGLMYLTAGGLIYSGGAVIYTVRKPNLFHHFGYHELWHVLVLIASFFHFLAIYIYVA
jgi:hemolysin III